MDPPTYQKLILGSTATAPQPGRDPGTARSSCNQLQPGWVAVFFYSPCNWTFLNSNIDAGASRRNWLPLLAVLGSLSASHPSTAIVMHYLLYSASFLGYDTSECWVVVYHNHYFTSSPNDSTLLSQASDLAHELTDAFHVRFTRRWRLGRDGSLGRPS